MSVVMTLVVSGPTGGVWSAVPGWNFISVTSTYIPGGGNHSPLQTCEHDYITKLQTAVCRCHNDTMCLSSDLYIGGADPSAQGASLWV